MPQEPTHAPADRYEPVAGLKAYDKNSRTHSPDQVDLIVRLFEEYGVTNSILVDEKGIVAGHGRQAAALKVYAKGGRLRHPDGSLIPNGCFPVKDCSGWSDEKRRAYIIADNQSALRAGWDMGLLKAELGSLYEDGFDLTLTGFEAAEIADLLAPDPNEGDGNPDDVPETPTQPVSQPGDVWELGAHRLICGDCTEAHVVEKVLGQVKPSLMVTDPPYGVEYDPSWREKSLGPSKRSTGEVKNDDRGDWREAWALFPGDVAYVWTGDKALIEVGVSLQAVGFELRAQIIWKKPRFVIGRGHYHPMHESAFYAVRKGGKGDWKGDRKQSTVWEIAQNDGANAQREEKTGHGTQKPVQCMLKPIENNSSPGQAIYEPFSGSGTTIIAAEMSGRTCFAIELNPAYVDVAVTRWAKFAGKTPILQETGETFAEVTARRLPLQTPTVKIKED